VSAAPLVSVITIFLDEERFLAEAVESVLAQTYEAWELLLVDDGSTDGSPAIARRYADAHPGRIHYLEHPGHATRGMSASRNLGLREARGAYVTFLDGDDVFLPAKLAEQVAIMEAHPDVAMVYGRALIWHGWTGRAEDAARDHRHDLGVEPETVVRPPRLFHLLLENRVQTPMTGNALMRRDVVERLGGFEESFRGLYEDQVFFFKVNLAHAVFVSDACWMKYRQQADGRAGKTWNESAYYARRRPLLEWLRRHLIAQRVDRRSEEWQAVQRELWRARYPELRRFLQDLGTRMRTTGRRVARTLLIGGGG
jgi:glycosyltransferase involved in cell wall biosynthesis